MRPGTAHASSIVEDAASVSHDVQQVRRAASGERTVSLPLAGEGPFTFELRNHGDRHPASSDVRAAQHIVETWREECTLHRPRSTLGFLSPAACALSLSTLTPAGT